MSTVVQATLEPKRRTSPRVALRTVLLTLLVSVSFLALGAGYGRYRFGSVSAGLAYLRGARFFVDEPIKKLESGPVETLVPLCYSLTNLTGHPVRLLGVTTTCTCTEVEKLPGTIGAGETIAARAKIKIGGSNPTTTGRIRLFTDESRSPEIVLTYSVRVARSDSPRSGRAE